MNKYPMPGVYPEQGSNFLCSVADQIRLLGRCVEIEAALAELPQPDLSEVPEEEHQEILVDFEHEVDLIREHFAFSGKAKHWFLETEDGLSLQYIHSPFDTRDGGKVVVLRSPFSTTCGIDDSDVGMGDLFSEEESVRAFCLSPELHAKATPYRNAVRREPGVYVEAFDLVDLDCE